MASQPPTWRPTGLFDLGWPQLLAAFCVADPCFVPSSFRFLAWTGNGGVGPGLAV